LVAIGIFPKYAEIKDVGYGDFGRNIVVIEKYRRGKGLRLFETIAEMEVAPIFAMRRIR
jgi:hypothetical protein